MQILKEKRILDCLNIDRKKRPEGLNDLIKADILKTINNYFEVNENDTLIKIDVLENGKYSLKMVAKAKSLKPLNFLH